MRKHHAFQHLRGVYREDEPRLFTEVQSRRDRQRSQIEMGSSCLSTFTSREESSTGTKDFVVSLSLKALKTDFSINLALSRKLS